MSGSLQITGFGFAELRAKLERMPNVIKQESAKLVFNGAQEIAKRAKLLAPTDHSFLKNMIVAEKEGEMGASVSALANYSGYVEWGTGLRVNIAIDEDERAYEEGFKTGKVTIGHYAQPFFFPAVYSISPKIIEDIKTMLQEVANG